MQYQTVHRGEIALNVAVEGSGPLILMVHGFPELSRSWRHQLGPLAAAGYTAAALDVRGYGGSSKPADVAAYSMAEMADDLVAVIDELGDGSAVLVGHDWGAGLVQGTCLLRPEKVAGVASLSVPTLPWVDVRPTELIAAAGAAGFFYQNYFLTPGVAEAELETDTTTFVRRLFHGLSGRSADTLYPVVRSHPSDSLLDDLPDPGDAMADWFSDDEVEIYARAFREGGLAGPLNRYRAQDLDWEQLRPSGQDLIPHPGLFIGGEWDPVRRFAPGLDLYDDPTSRFADSRGAHIIDGIGHWTQQEAPEEVNRLLLEFVTSLSW